MLKDATLKDLFEGAGAKYNPVRLQTGIYSSGFNMHFHLDEKEISVNNAKILPQPENVAPIIDLDYNERSFLNNYGVVDSITQWKKVYSPVVECKDRNFCVCFTHIFKKWETPGGWRWEKWGPYYGKQTQTSDYLYNEKYITHILVFQVYEFYT